MSQHKALVALWLCILSSWALTEGISHDDGVSNLDDSLGESLGGDNFGAHCVVSPTAFHPRRDVTAVRRLLLHAQGPDEAGLRVQRQGLCVGRKGPEVRRGVVLQRGGWTLQLPAHQPGFGYQVRCDGEAPLLRSWRDAALNTCSPLLRRRPQANRGCRWQSTSTFMRGLTRFHLCCCQSIWCCRHTCPSHHDLIDCLQGTASTLAMLMSVQRPVVSVVGQPLQVLPPRV